jgi:hypothetical protein
LGTDRAEFFLTAEEDWMKDTISITHPSATRLAIDRHRVGNEIRVEAFCTRWPNGSPGWRDLWGNALGDLIPFPEVFRPIFTNGWAEVAELEGFELPKGPPKVQPLD